MPAVRAQRRRMYACLKAVLATLQAAYTHSDWAAGGRNGDAKEMSQSPINIRKKPLQLF